MLETALITLSFFLGQFVYGTIGFAGTIIALGIGSFYLDIKLLLMIDTPIAVIGNIVVLIKMYKHINYRIFFNIIFFSAIGLILGGYILHLAPSEVVIKFFAVVLILVALLDFIKLKVPPIIEKLFLIISGVFQGLIGIGVLAIATMKSKFKNKTSFVATFALYFFVLNSTRLIQYNIQGTFKLSEIIDYWWIGLVVVLALILGTKAHYKIDEEKFKKIITLFLILAGIFYLFK